MQHRLPVESYTYTGNPSIDTTIQVLKEQMEVFKSRIKPYDTGHLHTTIYTLNHRIEELEKRPKEK